MNRYFLIFLFSICVYACSCTRKKPAATDGEAKALQLIKDLDTSTLSFLTQWNYTHRMNQYHTWTKVKDHDSLEYSILYSPAGDTSYIEIYNVANFLKDYTSSIPFDTTRGMFYGITKLNNTVTSIYPHGKISGSNNLLPAPVQADSLFTRADPFADIAKIHPYKDRFNFLYCTYSPVKGNYIRFSYSNTDTADILYYIPFNLTIHSNQFAWFNRFSTGKRLGENWIFLKTDRSE